MRLVRAFGAAAALLLASATPALAQQTLQMNGRANGELRQGDGTLQSGEFVDEFKVQGRAGQRVVVRMTSSAFDPYLMMFGPNGVRWDNDDGPNDGLNAVIDVTLPSNGEYTIKATSARPGERGVYVVQLGAGAGAPQQQTASSAAGATIAVGQSVNGALAQGDLTLDRNEFFDGYRLQARRGEQIVIRLRSTAFDPYLWVVGPNNFSEQNDDDESARGSRDSRIALTMPADGELIIRATSLNGGETGAYTLSVERPGAPQAVASTGGNGSIGNAIGNAANRTNAGGAARAPTSLQIGGTTNGRLQQGDQTISSGEFVDVYAFQGRRGQALDIRMNATQFDPYVMIVGPNGFSEFNDDDAGGGANNKNARLVVTLPADGAYRIQATSYQAGESGDYQLLVQQATGAAAPRPMASLSIGQSVGGSLAQGDAGGGGSAFEDVYTFQGRRGQRVALSMNSGAFDTLVALVAPSGAREQNDDQAQGNTNSLLETELSEDGQYSIVATSYAAGGTGAYQIALRNLSEGGARVAAPAPSAGSGTALTMGGTINGRLQQGDSTLPSGEFVDRVTFQGRRGQAVTVDMTSGEFDSYLILRAPSGAQQDNDDAAQGSPNARVSWTLPEDGLYTVSATSYRSGETGNYALRMSGGGSGPGPVASGARGRVFAVMVGISDYAGEASNLAYTADDARKLAETLRREGVLADQSVVLTDSQATVANVRSAFQRVAQLAGPNDMFLFFYSGHGAQVNARSGGEPDNRDEVLALRGGMISDDEMAQMFRSVRARVSILALDSCFSGGFARDVIAQPGVMGLFSSEEDLTSAVAAKFEAGGYLSHFLRTGLGGEADENHNRVVTAGEISSYLRDRFARDATGVESETMEGQRNYQFLVVDRGGVKIDDPLVMLP